MKNESESSPGRPRIRERVEDFEVEEVPRSAPAGRGEHLYLWIEKRGVDTAAVAREMARRAGVAAGQVGFAGRKDRHGVTRQWLSVPRWPRERAPELEMDGVEILRAEAGNARLRLGELAGNRFRIRVRGVAEELMAEARHRLEEAEAHGMPNRFGDQRFGHGGRNVERGLAVLRGEAEAGGREPSRRKRGFLVSAVQALAFNRILDRRPAPCHELLPGDLAIAHGSGRLIPVDDPASLAPRLERFAVSPTGPLFGSKVARPEGAVAELERQVLEELGVADLEALPGARELRLTGERRSLRARLRQVSLEVLSSDGELGEGGGKDLELRFFLPAGSYATALLGLLFPTGYEEGPMG
ncbi:MAG: tRNA pseudouridine(13) synthase TruD [Acidobacteriota bacterium]|nr:tRNA pseudouridine(13) synthase TruD [Acidobacteriota bacterium]